jgi:hypothetical protein
MFAARRSRVCWAAHELYRLAVPHVTPTLQTRLHSQPKLRCRCAAAQLRTPPPLTCRRLPSQRNLRLLRVLRFYALQVHARLLPTIVIVPPCSDASGAASGGLHIRVHYPGAWKRAANAMPRGV